MIAVQSSHGLMRKGRIMTEEERDNWEDGDLLSISDTAKYLRVTRQRVYVYIKEHRFPLAKKVGNQWVIPFEDVRTVEVKPHGRPRSDSDE